MFTFQRFDDRAKDDNTNRKVSNVYTILIHSKSMYVKRVNQVVICIMYINCE